MRDDGIAAVVEAPRRHIIERPRLTRLLDEADARILMLVAPAGYGKTTLARQWVESAGRNGCWINATPAVRDVSSFALRVRDTLNETAPEFGGHLEGLLRAGDSSKYSAETLGKLLASGSKDWDANSWLILDDYHHVSGATDVEVFLDAFLNASRIPCLITSRVRPAWATARRLLYGEIHELGQSALAMNYDEASAVLQRRGRDERSGLLALADGWPAIIGLAAESASSMLGEVALSGSLYEFFAEELYQAAAPEVQAGLVSLSFVPTLTLDICGDLLGDDCARVVRDGVRLGLLQQSEASTYTMHSLIRDFLTQRREEALPEWRNVVKRLAHLLAAAAQRDDLFLLATNFPEIGEVRAATNVMITTLLKQNRVELLSGWLELARRMRLDSPAIDLADAEIAFRNGRYNQAEVLAKRAADRTTSEPELTSRAWCRAGLSAYHENRAEQALLHHELALQTATQDEERLQAVWGSLAATLELERDATPLIAALEAASMSSPVSRVRLANARLSHSYRTGHMSAAIADAEAVRPLLARVHDPMVTSAFLNALSASLSLAGRYDQSLAVAEDELAVIDEYRLTFATPHGLICRATARMGRRNFTDAHRDLSLAQRAAHAAEDAFSLGNTAAARAKLLLSQGEPERALALCNETVLPEVPDSLRAEFLALQALSRAASPNGKEIDELRVTAASLTTYIETHQLLSWTRVVAKAIMGAADAGDAAQAALRLAADLGVWNPFVLSYRAFPTILALVAVDPRSREMAGDVIAKAHDGTIARGAGFDVPKQTVRDLSPRETEVLALIGEGLPNKEIGIRLFISEVTAKVHVRRILKKLGVRSRTEAALLAASYLDSGERDD